MNINHLNCEILHPLFAFVQQGLELHNRGDYQTLVELSSVCRHWRALVLPYLYERLCIECFHDRMRSNSTLIQSGGYTKYVRVLYINLYNMYIDNMNFAAAVKEARIAQDIWPHIRKLEIRSEMWWDEFVGDAGSNGIAAKEVEEVFHKHLPNITEMVCKQADEYGYEETSPEYPLLLVSELAGRYSHKLSTVRLAIHAGCLTKEYPLPNQLTHLDISMRGHEEQVLSRIFAPSLQCFRVRMAPLNITWSWLSSGDDGNQDHARFSRLTKLEVEFAKCTSPQPSYHSNNGFIAGHSTFSPDHRAASRRVHFPVLATLRIENYPYCDSSFYRLFEDSPLEKVDVSTPLDTENSLSPQILAKLKCVSIRMYLTKLQLRQLANSKDPSDSEKMIYEQAVTALMTTQSALNSVSLELGCVQTISLPDTLSWHSVQRLELDFNVDMHSLCAVLAQMPMLQRLMFRISTSHLKSLCNSAGSPETKARKKLRVVNKHVEYLLLRTDSELTERTLAYLLSNFLQLVPSLLKLRLKRTLVALVKDIMSDPANSLERLSQQLEVAGL